MEGVGTIFSPSTSYQILYFVKEEIEVTVVQMTIKKTTSSPNEDIQQSTKTGTPNEVQEEGDERNVDALLKTTINVFRMFDWFTKKGQPHILRKWSKEDATKEASSSNTTNKLSGRELF